MTCGACSAMIQKLLTGIDGIESSSVSLMLKRAEVIFNANQVSLDDIIEEIEDIGFDASELKISIENKNIFTIQLFYYTNNNHSKTLIIDKLMTIEGVSNVEEVKDNDLIINDIDLSYNNLPTVDMSSSLLTSFKSLSMMDDHNINDKDEENSFNPLKTGYGTTGATNKYNNMISIYLSISYDPKITGMRSVTEWINNKINTDFKCKILFDASDISQRKKNIQVKSNNNMHLSFLNNTVKIFLRFCEFLFIDDFDSKVEKER